jgi:hypothetical protein
MRQCKHRFALCAATLWKPSRFFAPVIFGVALLSGCGPRDAVYDTSAFHLHGTIAPPDVAVPTNVGDGPAAFNGLYLEGSSAFSCCWIAPHATLLVRKRGPANELVGGFRVPNVARFSGGQVVAISFSGDAAPRRRQRLQPGQQLTLTVPLPDKLRRATGLVPIDVASTVDYVPSRDNPPSHSLLSLLRLRAPDSEGDTRHLGVVVLYLYFK